METEVNQYELCKKCQLSIPQEELVLHDGMCATCYHFAKKKRLDEIHKLSNIDVNVQAAGISINDAIAELEMINGKEQADLTALKNELDEASNKIANIVLHIRETIHRRIK
jgi:hypothetical protein